MKLQINHEYFEQIKTGNKLIEYRDAHITFIDEETKEQIQIHVQDCFVTKSKGLNPNIKQLFTDDKVIGFILKSNKQQQQPPPAPPPTTTTNQQHYARLK